MITKYSVTIKRFQNAKRRRRKQIVEPVFGTLTSIVSCPAKGIDNKFVSLNETKAFEG